MPGEGGSPLIGRALGLGLGNNIAAAVSDLAGQIAVVGDVRASRAADASDFKPVRDPSVN